MYSVMNRQMRRAQAKAKPNQGRRMRIYSRLNRPMPHEVHMVFEPIEAFLRELASGEVKVAANGAVIFVHPEGEAYEAVPAVRGFMAAMYRILDYYQVHIDLMPVLKLCNKLDASMPITPEHVALCQQIITLCRKAYSQMDAYQVKSLVNTELIAHEFEQLNRIQKSNGAHA